MEPEFDEDFDVPIRPRTTLLKTLRATTASGRQISIPMYDRMPPYFDRPIKFDVHWAPRIPLDDTPLGESTSVPLVDKYTARQYGDLVSDEQSNRRVLDWLRRFKKFRPSKAQKKKHNKQTKLNKYGDEEAVEASHVLMLSGPPGCGKSTLIRVVASLCGFHVCELNASEDVASEKNQMLLNNQLDFEPVFGKKTRPLLVLEEMDGVGTLSESVMKAVSNLKGRPVIIAVNDPYAPALRSLRTYAQLVRMPPPQPSKFVRRLKKICELEGIDATQSALTDIAQVSRYDMRTSLNTLQFLAMRQPVTADMVRLIPVGVKNAALTPFDLWEALFSRDTKMEDLMLMMESFGDNSLLAAGVLENSEILPWTDPTGHSYLEMLEGLCYGDCAHGDLAMLGIAGMPRLQGVSRIGSRQLVFPSQTFGKEAQVRRNTQMLKKNQRLRNGLDYVDAYVNPSMQTTNVLMGRTQPELRARFVNFHKYLQLSYKKNAFGHFQSEPDIDTFLDYTGRGVGHLTRFREMIQRELDREQAPVKKISVEKLPDEHYLKGKRKQKTPVDFWGQKVEAPLSVASEDTRADLFYKYNEGFTNAVRRKVYLPRILAAV